MILWKPGGRAREPDHQVPESSAPYYGREPPTPAEKPRSKDDRTSTHIRLGPIDIRDGHRMSLKQIFTFLVLISALTSAFVAGLIILFDNVLDTLAAHSSQLARLDPKLVSATIVGVFAFMGVSVATRAVLHWARSRSSPGEKQSTETKAEFEELGATEARKRQGRPGPPCSSSRPPGLARSREACRRVTARGAVEPATAARAVMMTAATCGRPSAKTHERTTARTRPTTMMTTALTVPHAT